MRIEAFDDLVNFLVETLPAAEINSFRPPPQAQKRFNTLSNAVKMGTATPDECARTELYIQLEHMMQLAKARHAANWQNPPRPPLTGYQSIFDSTGQGEPPSRQRRCEYCLLHVDDAYYAHYVDFVIAKKHGGQTGIENFALSCAECNLRKGTELTSRTPTGRLVTVFNPRLQRWGAHFRVEGGSIEPLTRIGEATAHLMDFNNQTRVEIRRTLAQLKLYPRR